MANTNVQRLYQRQMVQGQVITTPVPPQVAAVPAATSFTAEQLKLIFPMGPPENFAPAPAAMESQQLVMPASMGTEATVVPQAQTPGSPVAQGVPSGAQGSMPAAQGAPGSPAAAPGSSKAQQASGKNSRRRRRELEREG